MTLEQHRPWGRSFIETGGAAMRQLASEERCEEAEVSPSSFFSGSPGWAGVS